MIYMPNVSSFRLQQSSTRAEEARRSLSAQTQSQEKIDLLKMLGAEVHPVPGEFCTVLCRPLDLTRRPTAVAFDNPENYNHRSSQSLAYRAPSHA